VTIPWSVASAAKGRLLGVGSVQRTITCLVIALIVLLVGRWFVVVFILQGH
jgi:hypothetical protein